METPSSSGATGLWRGWPPVCSTRTQEKRPGSPWKPGSSRATSATSRLRPPACGVRSPTPIGS
eukprot:656656-Lingulodinium_polyedra.AAC.1